jgi:hypothetical protein
MMTNTEKLARVTGVYEQMKQAAEIPGYTGINHQQFLPQQSRRGFSLEEEQRLADAESKLLPKIFKSWADPIHADMANPWVSAGALGVPGAIAGGLIGSGLTKGNPGGAMLGGIGLGGLGGLVGYLKRKAHNDTLREIMSRLPEDATRRDMLADSVVQRDQDRQNQLLMASMIAAGRR